MHKRDVLKVDFFPQQIPFPQFSSTTYLKQVAEDLLHLLQSKPSSPTNSPLECICRRSNHSWSCCCATSDASFSPSSSAPSTASTFRS
jgi:hypothetical protein